MGLPAGPGRNRHTLAELLTSWHTRWLTRRGPSLLPRTSCCTVVAARVAACQLRFVEASAVVVRCGAACRPACAGAQQCGRSCATSRTSRAAFVRGFSASTDGALQTTWLVLSCRRWLHIRPVAAAQPIARYLALPSARRFEVHTDRVWKLTFENVSTICVHAKTFIPNCHTAL